MILVKLERNESSFTRFLFTENFTESLFSALILTLTEILRNFEEISQRHLRQIQEKTISIPKISFECLKLCFATPDSIFLTEKQHLKSSPAFRKQQKKSLQK